MKLLELASRVALANNEPRILGHHDKKQFLLAAVVERDDGAIVVSSNIITQNPMPSAHAEARVLKKSDANCILYVARVLRNGDWAMSKPCPGCQNLIRSRRVSKVYYTIGVNEYGIWYPKNDRWYLVKREK